MNMKKALLICTIIVLGLSFASCQRNDPADPSWDGPSGLYLLVDGSANPAVLLINGLLNPSTIHVRVTNSAGTPIGDQLVFFRQFSDEYQEVNWGVFENGAGTISKVTNANGEASVVFFSPMSFISHNMYINALLQVNGHAYTAWGIPQDFIAIAMVNSGY